jgi:hypothetical protein
MATIPIKSMFGKLVGLTRATTTYPTERLFAKGGFIGPAIYLHATEGSETIVDIQGLTDVETSSTGTAAVATRGITIVAAGASTLYTLGAPPGSGIRKTFVATSTSTATRQIKSTSPIVTGAASTNGIGGDGSVISASTSMTVLTLAGLGHCIELVSISTSAWVNTGLRGFTSTNIVPLSS